MELLESHRPVPEQEELEVPGVSYLFRADAGPENDGLTRSIQRLNNATGAYLTSLVAILNLKEKP